MSNQTIIFEQPVNELIRVCLRVEHLLQLAENSLRGSNLHETRGTMSALTDILSLTERPDLRGKFIKEFLRQSANLQRFVNEVHIDQTKLTAALQGVEQIIQLLQKNNGKFGAKLRDNDFLISIRQHLAMPGGTCSFDTPSFYYFLRQPAKERHTKLVEWLSELEDLFQVIDEMLKLVRQSGQAIMHTAHEGFYQTSLDPQMPCQLIRVAVPNETIAFPEISVGRHGVSVRFYHPTLRERGVAFEKDVPFWLTCCIL
jgi:cell division protein ZapD